MTISYGSALDSLRSKAKELKWKPDNWSEEIPLTSAVGRITAQQYVTPVATPTFDSSAMDGFAVLSETTRNACLDSPVLLRVTACIMAGDVPCTVSSASDVDDIEPCVEIMTGGRFPDVSQGDQDFDAVVKIEDITEVQRSNGAAVTRCIRIVKPVLRNANKRFTGSDYKKDELIMSSRQEIRPQHVMAMSSLGWKAVNVVQKLRVALWSTGHELIPSADGKHSDSKIMDTNGPFLQTFLREAGVDVDFVGVLDDSPSMFKKAVQRQIEAGCYDLLVSTGAVSKGRRDFIPAALDDLGASILFHGVAMRPGHPVLFATIPVTGSAIDFAAIRSSEPEMKRGLPAKTEELPFFGIPGNPLAAAACMRMLVLPYIRYLQGLPDEVPIKARLLYPHTEQHVCRPQIGTQPDIFRHGYLSIDQSQGCVVEVDRDQSPAKVKHFARANCWCHFLPNHANPGGPMVVDCYPI